MTADPAGGGGRGGDGGVGGEAVDEVADGRDVVEALQNLPRHTHVSCVATRSQRA